MTTEQPTLPNVTMKPQTAPARPRQDNAHCLRATAIKLASMMGKPPTEQQLRDVEEGLEDAESDYADILKALDNNFDWCGYQLARFLDEELGWSMNAGIVQTLDDALVYRMQEHALLVEKWVKDYELTPRYAVGDTVTIAVRSKAYQGTIRRIYEHRLQYVVEVPELGHGLGTAGFITQGNIVNEEDIKK